MCDETLTAVKGGLKEGFSVEEGKLPQLNNSGKSYVVLISPQGKRYLFRNTTNAIEASHHDVFQEDYFVEEAVEG